MGYRRLSNVYRERLALVTSILEHDFHSELERLPSMTVCTYHSRAEGNDAGNQRVGGDAPTPVLVWRSCRRSGWAARRFRASSFGYGAIAAHDITEGLRRVRACME